MMTFVELLLAPLHLTVFFAGLVLDLLGLRGPTGQKYLSPVNNFGPVSEEHSDVLIPASAITGTIPRSFSGLFLRNGPNPQHHHHHYHWFDGDGRLHAVRIDRQGAVRYSSRWIRTERFEMERKAGRPLVQNIGQMCDSSLGLVRVVMEVIKNKGRPLGLGTANTALEFHADKLLALVENDLPTRVEAETLRTIGVEDFGGELAGAMTAHPKRLANGDLFAFRYQASKPFATVFWVSKDGKRVLNETVLRSLDRGRMVHDCAVTDTHAVIPLFPLFAEVFSAPLTGKPMFHHDQTARAVFAVVPHRCAGEGDVIMIDSPVPGGYAFHTANSFTDERGRIVLIMGKSEGCAVGMSEAEAQRMDPRASSPFLTEWVIDLASRSCTEKLLLPGVPVEFPHVHPALARRRTRFIWASILGDPTGPTIDGIVRYDYANNKHDIIQFPAGTLGGEFVIVPKSGSTTSEGPIDELAVYVMGFVHDQTTDTSSLNAWDGNTLDLAFSIKLPARVPMGFHGLWLSEDEIARQKI